jgi:hypothetical protein
MVLNSAVGVAQSGGTSVKGLVVQKCSSTQPWLNLRFHLTLLSTVARSQWGGPVYGRRFEIGTLEHPSAKQGC